MRFWSVLSVGAVLAGTVAASGLASGQAVMAVPKLDLNRFATGWYEIARLPNKPEKKCDGNAFQMYALGNKPRQFQLVQSCLFKDGQANVRNLPGKVDKQGDGKLTVGTFPFTSKFWVLATGPDFEWALMGSPNRKLLWVLSRKATMDAGVMQQLKATAAAQGYKVDKLEMVTQGK